MAHVETLPLLLKQLGLLSMLAHWEDQEAISQKRNERYGSYLANLAEVEVTRRYDRRIATYIKQSNLPAGKTLATFDFKATPTVNAQKFTSLADNPDWVRQSCNLMIFGPSGVGKTHLAAAIGYRMIEHGIRCLFTSTMELVQKLQAAKQQYKLPEMLTRLAKYPLLILDDIGYVKKNETETGVLFELIADRYETNSLIITANQPFSEWNNIFPDNMMAVAAIDRLIHHATVITIPEGSYRQLVYEKNKNQLISEIVGEKS